MNYQGNKERSKIRTTKPSLTDQSQAKSTDINVIVGQFRISGRVPGAPVEPLPPGDYSNVPGDLRSMIEETRRIESYRRRLPQALREKPIEELLTLTTDQLTAILQPPAAPPAPEKDGE